MSLTGRAWPTLCHSFALDPSHPLLKLWDTCCCCCLFAWCPSEHHSPRFPLFACHQLALVLRGQPLITMWRGSKEDVPHRQGGEEGTAFPPQGPGATFRQPNILNPLRTHMHTPPPIRAARVGTPCERALIITALYPSDSSCQVMKGQSNSFCPSLPLY